MRLREMNDYDLMHAIVDSGRPVVTAFVERGLPVSGVLEGDLAKLADELGGDAIFGMVDVSENPTIAAKFGAPDMPCVALFRDGKHLGTSCGMSRPELMEFVARVLKH